MGIFSWFRGSSSNNSNSGNPQTNPAKKSEPKSQLSSSEVPGMNGAVEVRRPNPPPDITVFEFGSVAASADKVTLAGYCPVSDDLEPCRWEILPASGSEAPQFRVVF
ncbi:OLC1v1031452C1 [Oldenlandia corymbosa var. corymbosa]|uniref:OLC1v1031452C1 n=1 Tax=Oldenlandia corymbosa var. corymbosa TaxID=529605 RepID=A0AAV1CLC7_OLDCO|nr:OLC1v1031452C1 [Oldenlandia corymbosa var. corymbosa]